MSREMRRAGRGPGAAEAERPGLARRTQGSRAPGMSCPGLAGDQGQGERGFGLTRSTHPVALWLPWLPQSTDQAQRPPRFRPRLALQVGPALPSPAPRGWEQPATESAHPAGSVTPPAPPRRPASVGPQDGLLVWRSAESHPHSPCPPTHHPALREDPPAPGPGKTLAVLGAPHPGPAAPRPGRQDDARAH